jgi:hypothetical protein
MTAAVRSVHQCMQQISTLAVFILGGILRQTMLFSRMKMLSTSAHGFVEVTDRSEDRIDQNRKQQYHQRREAQEASNLAGDPGHARKNNGWDVR